MAYNGSGAYSLPTPEYPAIPGQVIFAEDFNEIVSDIAAALSLVLVRDGQAPMTGALNMGNQGITNLATLAASVAGLVINGSVDFAGGVDFLMSVTGPTKAPGTNTTDLATCAFVLNTAMAAALPGVGGNAGKLISNDGIISFWTDLISTINKFADSAAPTKRAQFDLTGITAGQTRTMKFLDRAGYFGDNPRSARTSNTILGVQDFDTNIIITGAGGFTQTLTAAATLGVWHCTYWNFSSGNITFDPAGTEQIDGANTGILEPGMGIKIYCDATKFDCERIGIPIVKVLTSGTSGTWPLGVRRVNWEQGGAGGSGAKGPAGTTSGPGAAGGYLRKSLTVTPNSAYTYAIGAGGVSQTTADTDGNAGGSTTLTYNAVTYTTTGGAGGVRATGTYAAGGTATNGDINIPGGRALNTGSIGFVIPGSNPLGSPNIQANTIAPVARADYSSGGDGATSAQNSGAGAPGVIILSY